MTPTDRSFDEHYAEYVAIPRQSMRGSEGDMALLFAGLPFALVEAEEMDEAPGQYREEAWRLVKDCRRKGPEFVAALIERGMRLAATELGYKVCEATITDPTRGKDHG